MSVDESKTIKEAKERIYKRLLKWLKEHPLTEENLKGLEEQQDDGLFEYSRSLLNSSKDDKI